MHFVGTRYTKTQPDVSLSSGFTIERTFFLVHFKIVIFSEQCSAKSTKSKRLLITNQLLNAVLDTSSLILPIIPSNGPYPAACGKDSNLENVEAMN